MIVTIEKIYVWDDTAEDYIAPLLDEISGDYEVREYATASRAYCATDRLRRIGLDEKGGYEICYFKDYSDYCNRCAERDVLPDNYNEVIRCD